MEPAYYNNNVWSMSRSIRLQDQLSTTPTTSLTATSHPTVNRSTTSPAPTSSPTPPSSTTSTSTREEDSAQSATETPLWSPSGKPALLSGFGASWYSCCSGPAAGCLSWWTNAMTSATSVATAVQSVTGTALHAVPEQWWSVARFILTAD